jgi:hypothetical protein
VTVHVPDDICDQIEKMLNHMEPVWGDKPWATYRVLIEVWSPEEGRLDARYVWGYDRKEDRE